MKKRIVETYTDYAARKDVQRIMRRRRRLALRTLDGRKGGR